MEYRKLGNSELLISELGSGSWLTFTDPQRKQLAISCVHRALDLGISPAGYLALWHYSPWPYSWDSSLRLSPSSRWCSTYWRDRA